MSRYKSVKFDQFSDGEQCDVITPTDKSFENSETLSIQKNKVKLGPKIKNSTPYALTLSESGQENKCACFTNTFLNVIGLSAAGKIHIRKINIQDATISSVYTSVADADEAHILLRFKNIYICSIDQSGSKIQYSNDTMVSWTACGTVGTGMTIKDYEVISDRLYILCSDKKIYYSDDGISFTLLVTLDSSYSYDKFCYLDGYFYLESRKTTAYYASIIKITLAGEIQFETISFGIIYDLDSFVFNGNLYALINNRFLYKIDGSSLIFVFNFENDCVLVPSLGFLNFAFFFDKTNDSIIVMNLDEKFHRRYLVSGTINEAFLFCQYSDSQFGFVVRSGTFIKVFLYHRDKFNSSGSVESKIMKIPEDLAIPKQLILTNKPLSANAQIKVYVKKDQASSWGTAVIDSNATDAVRKIYNFPTGSKISFIQIKIEYLTADEDETPEDAAVEFVYLPVGIINSR